MHEISVAPTPTGWSLHYPGGLEPLVFLSGAKAEAAAHKLAVAIADAGHPVAISIFLRDGVLGGKFVCPPGQDVA